MGTFATTYPIIGHHCCLLTKKSSRKHHVHKHTQQFRSLLTLASALSDFVSKGNSNHVAKEYCNVISKPFFNIPLNQVEQTGCGLVRKVIFAQCRCAFLDSTLVWEYSTDCLPLRRCSALSGLSDSTFLLMLGNLQHYYEGPATISTLEG